MKKLEAEHWLAIKYLALPKRGGFTLEQIAKECGVHVNTLLNWRKDPLFEKERKKEMVRNTQDRLPDVLDSIINHSIEGNAAMAKLAMQVNDMLKDQIQVSTSEDNEQIDINEVRERARRLREENSKLIEE